MRILFAQRELWHAADWRLLAALYPIDTIKTRLQSATHGGGLRALLQRGGGKALYSGVWGNLVGVAPASAIFMAVYNPVKRAILDKVSCGVDELSQEQQQ